MTEKNGVKSLPKGFRFSKAIKDLIAPRLLCIKFSDEVEAMVAEDHILAEHVYNYMFPPEARQAYWEMVTHCRALDEDYKHDRITAFQLRMPEGEVKEYSYITVGSQSSTPRELDDAFRTHWRGSQALYPNLQAWTPANEEAHYKQDFIYPFDYGTMYLDIALLPASLKEKIVDFQERRMELDDRMRDFRYTLEPALLQIKSAKQFKEFLPNAFDALVDLAKEIKPDCSDLPVADSAKHINDLMG